MNHHVRIMPEAYEALVANAVWWAENRSPSEALKWYDGFISALEALGHMPESHPLSNENVRTNYELRELLYGVGQRKTHRALFRVAGSSVEVLTIRSVAQADLDDGALPS